METKSNNKSLYAWEISGAFFIIIAGSLLHFVYEWSGYSDVVGLFAPVNESVWEHLKLGFWALVLWGAIEFAFVGKKVNNFLLAKFLGAFALNAVIVIVFYTYTAFTGKSILAVDIGSFVLGVIICQIIVHFTYRKTGPSNAALISGAAGLVIIALAFMLFTYATPRLGIFRDGRNGAYGPVKMHISE